MDTQRAFDQGQILSSAGKTTALSSQLSDPLQQNQLQDNEAHLIQLLGYWLPKTTKDPVSVPKNREELIDFINKSFETFKSEETECWKQLANLHLMTPEMLALYQKKFVKVQCLNWIQLMCYKSIICPRGKDCSSHREQKMLNNQFYDFELECPYFHNKRDKRRIVLPLKQDEEFLYKGKYLMQQNINDEPSDSSFSYNYFESVYHPLFYKFFDCKRLQCKGSIYCAMKHSEEERIAWEEEFAIFWKKDRSIYYPKKGKNSGNQTEAGSEDGQQQPSQIKYYRNNNPDSRPNYQNNRSFNPYQPHPNQMRFNYSNNKGIRVKYQEKYRNDSFKKDGYFKKQGFDDQLDGSYGNYNDQYAQDFFNPDLQIDQFNSNTFASETDSQYTEFTSGAYDMNQGYDYDSSPIQALPVAYNQGMSFGGNGVAGGQYHSASKSKNAGFQDSDAGDGDLDFDSIFSSISQYSQSFNSTSTGSMEKKPLFYKKGKAFYPTSDKDGHIEVK